VLAVNVRRTIQRRIENSCVPSLLSTFNPVWEREQEYKQDEEDKEHPQDINNPKAAVS
jgi:hypothetical protein